MYDIIIYACKCVTKRRCKYTQNSVVLGEFAVKNPMKKIQPSNVKFLFN